MHGHWIFFTEINIWHNQPNKTVTLMASPDHQEQPEWSWATSRTSDVFPESLDGKLCPPFRLFLPTTAYFLSSWPCRIWPHLAFCVCSKQTKLCSSFTRETCKEIILCVNPYLWFHHSIDVESLFNCSSHRKFKSIFQHLKINTHKLQLKIT